MLLSIVMIMDIPLNLDVSSDSWSWSLWYFILPLIIHSCSWTYAFHSWLSFKLLFPIIVLYKNHLFFMFLSLLRRWLLMMSLDPYWIWHWSCLVLHWFLVYDPWFLAPWYLLSIWNHSYDSWSYYPLIVTPSMLNHILACYWFLLLDYCFLDFLLFLLFTIWSLISVFCVESSLLGYYELIISRDQSCLLFVALDSHPWILST